MTIDQPAAHGGAAQPGGASDGAGGFVGAVTEPAIPRYATTRRTDPAGAADELAAALDAPAQALVCVFGDPPLLRADGMAAALHARLGAGMLVGCTTAGELCPEGYAQGTLTAFALPASDYMVATALIENVSRAGPEAAAQAVVDAELRLRRMGAVIDSEHCFALLLVDGTTRAEEELCYALQAALGQVALVGGSAADRLEFARTEVLYGGRLYDDAAVLVLVATDRPFTVFRSQHIVATGTKLVVTGARARERVVTEIGGMPAAEAYAELVGVPVEALAPEVFARHPLLVRMGGRWYVRAIQKAHADGSLSVFCAIESGLVLSLGRNLDMVADLERVLDEARGRVGTPRLVIATECILRRLEAEALGLGPALARLFARHRLVGFSTYGEQAGAVHVNQTCTGVMLG